MDPFSGTAMLGAAGISAGAGLLSSLATSAFNIHESRENRRFQRNMSNNEMQRRVNDLRAAGLNPLMAVGGKGLGPASVPHTAAGQAEAPKVDALQAMQAAAGIQHTRAETAKSLADARKVSAESDFLNRTMEDRANQEFVEVLSMLERKDLTRAERDEVERRAINLGVEFDILRNQQSHSALDLHRMQAEASMYKQLGMFAPLLERGGPAAASAGIIGSLMRSGGRGRLMKLPASAGARVKQAEHLDRMGRTKAEREQMFRQMIRRIERR